MKRQSAPRWLVGLCCVLSAVTVVLALVLGNVILTRRQAAAVTPPASQAPTPHSAPVQPDPEPDSPPPAEGESKPAFHTIGSALLYCIQNDQLEYDVTHTISVETATVIDLTGTQITSLTNQMMGGKGGGAMGGMGGMGGQMPGGPMGGSGGRGTMGSGGMGGRDWMR